MRKSYKTAVFLFIVHTLYPLAFCVYAIEERAGLRMLNGILNIKDMQLSDKPWDCDPQGFQSHIKIA